VDLERGSPNYGSITSTPKAGWQNCAITKTVSNALVKPVAIDTDVNAAALGEHRWGAAQGLSDFMYLTVGTGIGGGAMINGHLVHGMLHPEMGHIRVPHDLARDAYRGICPYHGDCLEGLATGPAMEERWGRKADQLPPDHPAWALEAHYLALALCTWVCTISPKRILLGGGVMQQAHLFPLIRKELAELLNGYIRTPEIMSGMDDYVAPPALGSRAGVLGALALAQQMCSSAHSAAASDQNT
jgi:fructokinase